MALTLIQDPKAHATMTQQFDFVLQWTPEQYYPAGSHVELRGGPLRAFFTWKFYELDMEGADVVYRWKTRPTVSDNWRNPNFTLIRAKLQYAAHRGTPMSIRMRCLPAVFADVKQHLVIWTIPPGSPRQSVDDPLPEAVPETESKCALPLHAGPVARLRLYAKPTIIPGKKARVRIVPHDACGNPTAFENPVTATLSSNKTNGQVMFQKPTMIEFPADTDTRQLQLRIPMSAFDPNGNIENGRIEGENIIIDSTPLWQSVELSGDLQPAFGEIHWHTDFSGDGQRPIDEALRCAREDMALDFAAPGDHDTAGEDWQNTVKSLEQHNRPGEFATFFGWEASSRIGHENYYFTDPEHPMRGDQFLEERSSQIPRDNVEILKQYDNYLAIPHHTNAVAESRRIEDDAPFWHPYDWSTPTPAHRLVEIFQGRGNQERETYPTASWMGWHQQNGGSVQTALERGYRLGFVGGTDNHAGRPGRGFGKCEGTGHAPVWSEILTGVWTTAIDRQPVFDALYARHTWAVWNTRAVVWFSINNAIMGDELSVADTDTLKVRIKIDAESPFQTCELVSEKQIIWQTTCHQPTLDTDVELPVPKAGTHIYLRALLRSGGLLYASPIFIER